MNSGIVARHPFCLYPWLNTKTESGLSGYQADRFAVVIADLFSV